MRMDSVEYSNRVMRYSGTLLQGALSDDLKSTFSGELKKLYCATRVLQEKKLSVEYVISDAGIANIND